MGPGLTLPVAVMQPTPLFGAAPAVVTSSHVLRAAALSVSRR